MKQIITVKVFPHWSSRSRRVIQSQIILSMRHLSLLKKSCSGFSSIQWSRTGPLLWSEVSWCGVTIYMCLWLCRILCGSVTIHLSSVAILLSKRSGQSDPRILLCSGTGLLHSSFLSGKCSHPWWTPSFFWRFLVPGTRAVNPIVFLVWIPTPSCAWMIGASTNLCPPHLSSALFNCCTNLSKHPTMECGWSECTLTLSGRVFWFWWYLLPMVLIKLNHPSLRLTGGKVIK